jgi:hypothetical protein
VDQNPAVPARQHDPDRRSAPFGRGESGARERGVGPPRGHDEQLPRVQGTARLSCRCHCAWSEPVRAVLATRCPRLSWPRG